MGPGSIVNGRYRLEARVASGGFGAVYRATELPTGCDVAVKILHSHLTTDAIILERFRREGELLALLRDPHTVATYDSGATACGSLYLAMEWLAGETVVERCARTGPLPWRQVVAVARAVCCALGEAHLLGIIHRDLKPANIQLEPLAGDDLGFVKVLDFGIAKILRAAVDGDPELTRAGEVVGTIEYMAPEQIVDADLDARTDLYSLGVVLYELVTGQRPFAWATEPAMLIGAMFGQLPRAPSAVIAEVPPELDRILLRCLAVRPQQRYADVAELVAALDALERIEPDARKSSWQLARATLISDRDDDAETMICTPADAFGAAPAPGLALAVPAEPDHRPPIAAELRPTVRFARGSISPAGPLRLAPPILVTSYARPPVPRVEPTRWRFAVALGLLAGAIGVVLAFAL